jgi:hypothetical protein
MSPIIVLDRNGYILYGHRLVKAITQAGLPLENIENIRVFGGICSSCFVNTAAEMFPDVPEAKAVVRRLRIDESSGKTSREFVKSATGLLESLSDSVELTEEQVDIYIRDTEATRHTWWMVHRRRMIRKQRSKRMTRVIQR